MASRYSIKGTTKFTKLTGAQLPEMEAAWTGSNEELLEILPSIINSTPKVIREAADRFYTKQESQTVDEETGVPAPSDALYYAKARVFRQILATIIRFIRDYPQEVRRLLALYEGDNYG